jgi:hypothetical protein
MSLSSLSIYAHTNISAEVKEKIYY